MLNPGDAAMPILFSLLFLFSSPVSTHPGFFVRIPLVVQLEAELAAGRLPLEEALRVRELAVKNPEKLPEPWRARVAADPVPGWAATGLLVENFQIRKRQGLRNDYGFPEPLAMHFDSTLFPIRVEFPGIMHQQLAQAVLTAAETSWQKEIVDWGFYPPPIVSSFGRYRILVQSTGMAAAGYLAPVDWYEDTPWDDCTSYIVIDQGNDQQWVRTTVAHELSHATQAAMDCLEHIAFWENTSTFIEAQVDPGVGIWFQNWVLESFQREPHRSVSAGEYMDLYWYGGFLWPHFLATRYNQSEHPAILVRRMWEGAMQESGGTGNDIHYMKSIENLLAEQDIPLNEAHEEFALQRYLVDSHATSPLSTMTWADRYTSIPPLAGNLIVSRSNTASPSMGMRPQPYGTNYWELSWPTTFTREVSVTLTTDEPGPWTLLSFNLLDETVHKSRFDGEKVQFTFLPDASGKRYLAVVRGGTPMFYPESLYVGADYVLEAGPAVPDPVILEVTPFEHHQGDTGTITVSGMHFQPGAVVSLLPGEVEVLSVEITGPEEVLVEIAVPQDAPLGAFQLRITNPDGGSAILERAIYVLPPAIAPSTDKGCSCRAGNRKQLNIGWMFLLVAGLVFFRRFRFGWGN